MRMNRKCQINPDSFCYISSNVVLSNRHANITDFVKKAYRDYFGVKLGAQDKAFAPHIYCKIHVENFRY